MELIENNTSKYLVSFGEIPVGCYSYTFNCKEVTIDDTDCSEGTIAQMLEKKVAELRNNTSVVIINFWKI